MSSTTDTAKPPPPPPGYDALPHRWTPGATPQTYKGACHCHKVEFEFEHTPIDRVLSCNCSICSQRGALFVYTPRFHFTKGSFDDLTAYQFNRKIGTHYFCPTCGSGLCAALPDKTYAVNTRAVEGLDLASLKIDLKDGKSS